MMRMTPQCQALLWGLLFLQLTMTTAWSAEPIPVADLEALVEEALLANPDLQAAAARWEESSHKIIPARSLDDPTLSLAFSNYPLDSLDSDQTPMTGNELQLTQNFPFPGKLRTKGKIAELQAAWFKEVYEDQKLRLAAQVKDSFFRVYSVERAMEVVDKNLAILQDFTRLMETRYEVGQGLQQDVLKAQLEYSKLLDKQLDLRQQRVSALADLNSLLDRPAATEMTTAAEWPLARGLPSTEALKEASQENRPLYRAYRAVIENYRAQGKLAELDFKPDLRVWAGYRFRDDGLSDGGTDFVSAGVGINLPIYREKRREKLAQAHSGLRMAQAQYDQFRNRTFFKIHDARAQLEKSREQVLLYRDGILPQAEQTFRASLAAYQVDKVDFLTLLDALMKLHTFEMEQYRLMAEHQRSLALLEAETGIDLRTFGEPANP